MQLILRYGLIEVLQIRNGQIDFQLSKIVHLSTHASDHLPILLHVQSFTPPRQQRGRSFKFEESWLLRTECEEIVQEAWGNAGEERVGLAAI